MTTVRIEPIGDMLENGYQSLVAFAADPGVNLWEKIVTPPGVEGGEKIDITTMWNTKRRTYAAQALSEVTDSAMTVGYDPASITGVDTLVNVPGEITYQYPDASTWDVFGYLRNFQPTGLENGVHPEAACTIVATNVDPSDGSEADIVYTAPTP